tara:strand:- start:5063 stop:5419 length:357 start_codon:yes stop_codon:yes gene_type:complete
MNLRQIKAIRKLFLAYGQPGTVDILPWHYTTRSGEKLPVSSLPTNHAPHYIPPQWTNLKTVSEVKSLPVSTGYIYRVKVRTPDTSGWHGIHWVKCVDLTDLKNPKFAIHKEESANAPA